MAQFIPSENCLNLIKGFENCYLNAYQGKADRSGVITIGWGTVLFPDGHKPKLGDKITQAQADTYLNWEVNQKAKVVNEYIEDAPVTQSMFDALVSFAYNLGLGSLEESTLLKKLKVNPNDSTIYDYTIDDNTGYGVEGSCEFLKWVYSNGTVVDGLRRRRTSEAHLYKTNELNFFES